MNEASLKVRLPPKLKTAAMRAASDKRGGLSQVIRELLADWLKDQPQKGGKTPQPNQ